MGVVMASGSGGVGAVDGADAYRVRQEVEEAELGAQETGKNPYDCVIIDQQMGGDEGELEEFDGGHGGHRVDRCGGRLPEGAEDDIEHGGVEGVAEVLVDQDESGLMEAREDSGRDDGEKGEDPGDSR